MRSPYILRPKHVGFTGHLLTTGDIGAGLACGRRARIDKLMFSSGPQRAERGALRAQVGDELEAGLIRSQPYVAAPIPIAAKGHITRQHSRAEPARDRIVFHGVSSYDAAGVRV